MKRRDVLEATGTVLAGSVALTGLTGARSTGGGVAQARVDANLARSALATETDLLDQLADDGVIETASLDSFDFDAHAETFRSDDGVGLTTARIDGAEAPLLTVSRTVEDGRLTINVPVGEFRGDYRAFALLDTAGGTETYNAVETASCPTCQSQVCTCKEECPCPPDADYCSGCCAYDCYCVPICSSDCPCHD